MNKTTKYILEHQDDLALRTGMEEAYRGVENAIADEIRKKRWDVRRRFGSDWKNRFKDGRLGQAKASPRLREVMTRSLTQTWTSQCYWNGPDAVLERIAFRLEEIETFLFWFVARKVTTTNKKLHADSLKAVLDKYEDLSFRLRKLSPRLPKAAAEKLGILADRERTIRSLAKSASALVAPPEKEPAVKATKSADEAEGRPCDAPDWEPNF